MALQLQQLGFEATALEGGLRAWEEAQEVPEAPDGERDPSGEVCRLTRPENT